MAELTMAFSIRKLVAAVCVAAALGLTGTQARSAVGDRVLVVLEPKLAKADYSAFWADLEGERARTCGLAEC